jgi:hypothetical protein
MDAVDDLLRRRNSKRAKRRRAAMRRDLTNVARSRTIYLRAVTADWDAADAVALQSAFAEALSLGDEERAAALEALSYLPSDEVLAHVEAGAATATEELRHQASPQAETAAPDLAAAPFDTDEDTATDTPSPVVDDPAPALTADDDLIDPDQPILPARKAPARKSASRKKK